MSRLKIFSSVAFFIIVISFLQYKKSQIKLDLSKVPPPPVELKVVELSTKPYNSPKIQDLPKPPVIKPIEEIRAKVMEPTPSESSTTTSNLVNVKIEEVKREPAPSKIIKDFNNKNPSSDEVMVETNKSPEMIIKDEKLPEITLFLPDKENLTKSEKIIEIRNLVNIFEQDLIKIYTDKSEYEVSELLQDCVDYYEDPVAFEKMSTYSFMRILLGFIEDVHKLRKEAHQRYLLKHKL